VSECMSVSVSECVCVSSFCLSWEFLWSHDDSGENPGHLLHITVIHNFRFKFKLIFGIDKKPKNQPKEYLFIL